MAKVSFNGPNKLIIINSGVTSIDFFTTFSFKNDELIEYFDLIKNKNKDNTLVDYYEKHHIFPKCVFGNNNLLINLSAKEHYCAHKLLWLSFKKNFGKNHIFTRFLCFAFTMMKTGKNRVIENDLDFEQARRDRQVYLKLKIVSEDSKKKMRESSKKRWTAKKREEQRIKMLLFTNSPGYINPGKGKKRSKKIGDIVRLNNFGNERRANVLYKISSPSGEIFLIKNMSKFYRENNIKVCLFKNILRGTQKSTQGGWTIKKI
jgi:hypothetical protein